MSYPTIKPCPFCGYSAFVVEVLPLLPHEDSEFRVQCWGPKPHTLDHWDISMDAAIETWNQRSSK